MLTRRYTRVAAPSSFLNDTPIRAQPGSEQVFAVGRQPVAALAGDDSALGACEGVTDLEHACGRRSTAVGEQVVACGIRYTTKNVGGCGWVYFPAGTTTLRDGPYVGFY